MLAQVHSFVLQGIEPINCEVEVDVEDRGLAKTMIVGLPDAAVKESIERVRSAISNSGFSYPDTRLLVNLAPADIRKESTSFDLPIAVGLLLAERAIQTQKHKRYLFAGELALDGRIRPIRGAINLAILGRDLKLDGVVVPIDNAHEAAAVDGINVYAVDTLTAVVGFLNDTLEIEPHSAVDFAHISSSEKPSVDFVDVRGQEGPKRAMTIAAAGAHNLIMIGPAGTGKTMMAKALAGILPPLTHEEALQVTRVHSCAGLINKQQGLVTTRPVRTPHHTASSAALIGGGVIPRPGDVSLAHHGVLFLDEMPEFPRLVLETLRQPLEDGCVTISRAHGTVKFPARLMLVAAMNPTHKGDKPTDSFGKKAMDKYLSKLSGPLIDRIDIHVEVPAVPHAQLMGEAKGTTSEQMREQVVKCREIQVKRPGAGGKPNSALSGRELDKMAKLDGPSREVLKHAMSELGLSARAYDKVRRVSRTIADLEGQADIQLHHLAEAIQYRLLDRKQ